MSDFKEVLGLPVAQCNAPYEDRGALTMRVGIPHRSGGLAAHAFRSGYQAMVSANAFYDRKRRAFRIPDATDLSEVDFALDSAGFMAIALWKAHGTQDGMAGVYPWSLSEYLAFATQVGASWYAAPDLCCEPEVAGSAHEIDYRVRATATLLEATLRQLWVWQNEVAKQCNARTVANMLPPPIPILQGWRPADYLRSLELTMQVWRRWEPWIAPPALIGIGSVCRRALHHRDHGLMAVLAELEGRLPEGARLHLFGVKGACLEEVRKLPWVGSIDSMAFDVGARRAALIEGKSNTIQHRAKEMTRWMIERRCA
ncbi:hypothetical protein Bpfe_031088 [Biomphalaria pfeifferi]|uniref:DeoxyPurine in DNA protein A domain-containing protein n=1 Tax=Biomphalaria pfeifferi TaxID=112525 RepID=A0AAD8EUB7_BIOPF|nr:hypothetical protein Bpfe_031088 [Biomphalaria pfeifferi]